MIQLRIILFKNIKNNNGTALLEFTLIALLFFFVLFGIIEFGFLLYNQQVITNAGREGARSGIVCRPDDLEVDSAEIINTVQNYAEQHIVAFGTKNFVVNPQFDNGLTHCDQFQDKLTVEVTYDYSFLFLPFATKTLGTRAIMICE